MRSMGIAENLRRIREAAELSQVQLAHKAGVSQQLVSQIEGAKNTTTKKLPLIARALGVAVEELDENYSPAPSGRALVVPLLSWISAGALLRNDARDEALGEIRVTDLPDGDWFALEVTGDSMDRISPPESRIFVNRKDKRLVPNGLYVIADEEGNATYKRYRPGPPMRFEPVSTNPAHEPLFPDQDPVIVGRVRRSVLDT